MIGSTLLILRMAMSNVSRYASRSFLTALGIAVSVASLIIVVTLVQGVTGSVTRSFDTMGATVLTVRSETPFSDQMLGKRNRISLADYAKLSKAIPGVTNFVPSFFPFDAGGTSVRTASNATFTRVMAVAPGYQDTYKTYPASGRFFTSNDEQTRRKVCVIGERARTALKLPRDPVGEFINVKGNWFKVIGLMESRGELFGVSQDDYVLIPFASGEAVLTTSDRQDISIAMNLRSTTDMELVSDRITMLLRRYHNLEKGQENDFTVMTARQLSASFGSITGLLTLVLGGMMSISLVVGGIGIMNIMLASVNERIREVGICKALGAQRHHILLQFLFESSIIATLGGIAGAMIGLAVSWAVTWAFPAIGPFVFPMWTVLASIGFSLLVGLFFGVAPAAQAASLDPIDALRRE